MMTTTAIRSLDDLLDALTTLGPEPKNGDSDYETRHGVEYGERAAALGLPVRGSQVIWDELPVFGGAEPSSSVGVWSWDHHRLLVGEGFDWRIVEREQVEDGG